MSDLCYCQYAFTQPECRVQEIGPGVDPRFDVELIREGPIAALASRVGFDEFAPERLQGTTAEDIQWLGKVAARHNEIICRAASSSAVLPLRLGTVFQSRDSLQTMLVRRQSTIAQFLQELGNRQEWGVKLYLEGSEGQSPTVQSTLAAVPTNEDRPLSSPLRPLPGHVGPPAPHYLAPPQAGTAYLTSKKAQLDGRRELRANMHRTIQTVEQRLTGTAEQCCRIRNLPSGLTGRTEEMVFNAAYLLPSTAQASWLETVQHICREVCDGLVLEISGPWPPYHFCPNLES
jgi:hypothetical protein